jgi:hypothetical protein
MKKSIYICLLVFSASVLSAQFKVEIIGSIPTGEFAEDPIDFEGSGSSNLGFGGALGYYVPTKVEGLSMVASVG